MRESVLLMLPIVLPVLAGLLLLLLPEWKNRKALCAFVGAVLCITGTRVFANIAVVSEESPGFILFWLTKTLPVYFRPDTMGKIFMSAVTVVWVLAGFFSFEYMKHQRKEKRYYGFYLIVYGVLAALGFSGNLITFYFFYELMTLTTLPLVLHTQTKEAVMAGLKYL